ncbi:MAG: hypothetical protein K1V99_07375, partial [Bacteroidales bacterium]
TSGTITKHNNMDINTLQKHMVPNGTRKSTLGTPPRLTIKANLSDAGPDQQFFDYFCQVIFVR